MMRGLAAVVVVALASVGVALPPGLERFPPLMGRPIPPPTPWGRPPPPPTTPPPEVLCHLPCSCVRLSRWTLRMRAHCVVVWLPGAVQLRPFHISRAVDEVDFTRSRIRTLHPGHLTGLENIKVMRMEEVGLESVTTFAFSRLSQLWSLSLARNHLSTVPEATFQNLAQLHHLSLRGNPLATLSGRPLLVAESLQVLDLADCRISSVDSATFQHMPALRQLHLESNTLRELPADAMAPLTQLFRLFLQANRLLFFPSEAIKKLPALLEARLDNNTQMEGPLGPLEAPHLQRLSAAGCALESLQPNLLAGAPELRYLELPQNRLRSLGLAGEPDGARLVLLDAADNPLECDCALRDSWDWAQLHVDEARVSCGSPPTPWGDAGLGSLHCDQAPDAAGSTSGVSGGGGAAAALWISLSLVAVLAAVGAGLLFVYRHELMSRFFTPEGRAAASSGIDVVPLEESPGDDAASEPPPSGQQFSGGIAPWLDQ